MVIGTKIPKYKTLSSGKELNTYNKPKRVYIPLISGNDTNITVLVKKGDYVLKGSEIGRRKGNFSIPLHSSVSGVVVGFEEKTIYSGEKVKCVVIENDFKEKTDEKIVRKKITDISKEDFREILKNAGIKGMGGADFPTYIKYQTEEKIKTLIVNAVECEPYITSDDILFKNRCEEILECIDAIIDINNIDEAYIAIKCSNVELRKRIETFIGTYPKIKLSLVPDLYPMGWEKSLVRFILNTDYGRLPIERGVVVNNVSTIYAMYGALKTDKPLIERVITFSGEMFKSPQNVLVRVGTPISEVLGYIDGTIQGEYEFVAGGPMMGSSVPSADLVVTSNLNCVLALKKRYFNQETECLRCGKCVYACPALIAPVLIKDYIDNENRLKELEVNRCIECGLCSYVCPALINVRQYVREAKIRLRGSK